MLGAGCYGMVNATLTVLRLRDPGSLVFRISLRCIRATSYSSVIRGPSQARSASIAVIAHTSASSFSDMREFCQTPDYDHVRAYLNILELMAVGVHHNTFDERICYAYWRDFIKGSVTDCRPLLDYLRILPSGGFSYGDLVRLENRWTSAKRFWQRWRR
jgi:hypothetical protein